MFGVSVLILRNLLWDEIITNLDDEVFECRSFFLKIPRLICFTVN